MSQNNSAAAPPMDENFRTGVSLLYQAYCYAEDAKAELWDFALEIDTLYESGITISDLRWLVTKGFVEHGQETSVYGDAHRSFRPSSGLKFTRETCFVLTASGAQFAKKSLAEPTGAQ